MSKSAGPVMESLLLKKVGKCNGLKEEDLVVFEHTGDMVFNVVAYDSESSECEKEYPTASGVAANRLATSSKAQSNKHHHASKGKGLLKATKCLTSRKQFKIKMAKTHGSVNKAYVTIPAPFARENGLHSISKLILNDPLGRLWPVSLSHWGTRLKAINNRLAIKTKGWYKFYESNNLKDGDVCLFKLKRMSRSISTAFMHVKITRHRS